MSTGTPEHHGRVPEPRTGRDRRHLFPGRPRAVNARFTDDEYIELATAANLAGLTPTGFCAQAALDAARNLHANTADQAEHHALGSLQAELFNTRVTVNQLRAELTLHLDTDDPTTAHLSQTVTDAGRSLISLDAVIARIDRWLAQRRPAGRPKPERRSDDRPARVQP